MAPFQTSLMTRGYELNADGVIPAQTMLRYMEHARWEALADEATGLGVMFQDGNRMVVRAQQLHVERSVGHSEELRIALWVTRVGRASVDLMHEIVQASTGAIVARGVVTGVYLDVSGRPQAVPPHVKVAGDTTEHDGVARPLAESPSGKAFQWPLVVRHTELDLFRHVNHANYLAYFEDARWNAEAQGASIKPLTRVHLDYRREALAGERVTVLAWQLEGESAWGFHLVRDTDGEVVCRALAVSS